MTAPSPTAPLIQGATNIDVSAGLYVHITYNLCGLCQIVADCYPGTLAQHPQKPFATVTIPHILCNFCHMCNCSCLIDTVCPIKDESGKEIGQMNLGKDCSCLCCTPRLSVTVNNQNMGKVHNKFMRCNFEAFEANNNIAYTSKCCNTNKWLTCLIPPCWNAYRCLFTNRTVTENYCIQTEDGSFAFDVVNVLLELY